MHQEIYESSGGYFYLREGIYSTRISHTDFEEFRRRGYKQRPNKDIPHIGDKVEIAIKPYKGVTKIGIVKRVLTKKKYHSRGHKVMITDDTVGRIIRVILTKKQLEQPQNNQ